MEGRESVNGEGVTDAPSDNSVAQRIQTAGPTPSPAAALVSVPPPAPSAAVPGKKKRGRPRKYGPEGSTVTIAKPISSSAPWHIIDFSVQKRGKVKPATASSVNESKYGSEIFGEWVACSVGANNFTPHIITVDTGEDVTMKIISFSQQGPRAICILSANGVISSVTLRQPRSSGGTLTYEGRFEILSLSGSFMPSNSGETRSRLSVSLSGPDGRVVGGGLAGLLVAASPIQVVVGSFLARGEAES